LLRSGEDNFDPSRKGILLIKMTKQNPSHLLRKEVLESVYVIHIQCWKVVLNLPNILGDDVFYTEVSEKGALWSPGWEKSPSGEAWIALMEERKRDPGAPCFVFTIDFPG